MQNCTFYCCTCGATELGGLKHIGASKRGCIAPILMVWGERAPPPPPPPPSSPHTQDDCGSLADVSCLLQMALCSAGMEGWSRLLVQWSCSAGVLRCVQSHPIWTWTAALAQVEVRPPL